MTSSAVSAVSAPETERERPNAAGVMGVIAASVRVSEVEGQKTDESAEERRSTKANLSLRRFAVANRAAASSTPSAGHRAQSGSSVVDGWNAVKSFERVGASTCARCSERHADRDVQLPEQRPGAGLMAVLCPNTRNWVIFDFDPW